MTEAEWLTCTDPEQMERCLHNHNRRKWGLFGAACCRQIWDLISDQRSRRAIEVAERFLDGQAQEDEWGEAAEAAYEARHAHAFPEEGDNDQHENAVRYAHAATSYLTEAGFLAVSETAMFARWAANCTSPPGSGLAPAAAFQCHLLRDIYGGPSHRPIINPLWMTNNTLNLARAAYGERLLPSGHLDLVRLAVLADALEEAGCTDHPAILDHLRGHGPHVRGCHILDLLLARE